MRIFSDEENSEFPAVIQIQIHMTKMIKSAKLSIYDRLSVNQCLITDLLAKEKQSLVTLRNVYFIFQIFHFSTS